jgi:predicted alpha/beta-hydrolase family hydrolase
MDEPLTIPVGEGAVSGLLRRPERASFLYILAHGAGAGMRHRFLEAMAGLLAGEGIATLRYQFPYMEHNRKRPDTPAVAVATVRAAVDAGIAAMPGVPLLAGGKSFGGRMTSTAAAAAPLQGVRGLVFLGYPLHPPGKPGIERAAHLASVRIPMLFLQGTRDEFARADLLHDTIQGLGRLATLHLVPDGDHSFAVRRASGQDPAAVLAELASTIASWARGLP